MKLLALLSLFLAPLLTPVPQDHPAYAVGQVWEYHARPQDSGSLIKIQQIERDPRGEPIYHISVIGFAIGTSVNEIGHLPVSRATLDASVTRLATSTAKFPDAAPGISEWRAAKGGVFNIPVAAILDILEKGIAQPPPT